MPLTDEQLNNNFGYACQLWGYQNSISSTVPVNDPTENGNFGLRSDGNTITIMYWDHDSPRPTIDDLKSLNLAALVQLRRRTLANQDMTKIRTVAHYLIDMERRMSVLEGSPKTIAQARDYIRDILRDHVDD